MASRGLEPSGQAPSDDDYDDDDADDTYNHDADDPHRGHHDDHKEDSALEEEDEVTPTEYNSSSGQLNNRVGQEDQPSSSHPHGDPDSLALSRLSISPHSNGAEPEEQQQPTSENDLALTLLPPNELSTTTTEAAQAASTFAEMMKGEHVRYSATSTGYVGIDQNLGGENYVGETYGGDGPGLVVDRSGVVRRAHTGEKAGRRRPGGAHPAELGEEEEEEEEEEDSSEISASDEDGSWIAWFCGLRGNEFFCEVDEDYIQDDFNLTGLNGLVPYYDYALDMVLDVEMPMEDSLTEEQQEIVESAAEMLYGLIHARYIVTNRGMHAMYEKYRSAAFGRCPNVFCQGQPVLPVGLSDLPRNYTVNVFCPRCHGLFFPKSTRQANIDGAYFGTTFPHLYLMTHPEMIPVKPSQQYIPRVFGFKIHQSSVYFRNNNEDEQIMTYQNDHRSRWGNRSRQGGGRR
ncbi:hypothetical protein ACHAW6_008865 [Cyclotella cf. meneghiniana]